MRHDNGAAWVHIFELSEQTWCAHIRHIIYTHQAQTKLGHLIYPIFSPIFGYTSYVLDGRRYPYYLCKLDNSKLWTKTFPTSPIRVPHNKNLFLSLLAKFDEIFEKIVFLNEKLIFFQIFEKITKTEIEQQKRVFVAKRSATRRWNWLNSYFWFINIIMMCTYQAHTRHTSVTSKTGEPI